VDSREAHAALGLPEGSSAAEIKSAFRQAALWCHPDRNPGNGAAEEAFKRITAAYEFLSAEGLPTAEPTDPQHRNQPRRPRSEPTPGPAPAPSSRWTWSRSQKIAGLLWLSGAICALGYLVSQSRPMETGDEVQAASEVETAAATVPITARFRSRCPFTAQKLADESSHWCLVLELENPSGRELATDSFAVRIDLSRPGGQLVPLRASPRGPPATFAAGRIHLRPSESLLWIVRGVTTERLAAESVRVTPVLAR
jgi:hypothetical protein